jgi:4-amino-4-deoxy-L-arabinose transferase-like glycosyltransferase
MQTLPRGITFLLIILGLTVYLAGLPVKVMDIDAAQYASISREMADSNRFLTVVDRGEDYLDKPPLLFWLAALFFKLFGVSTVAYKLPSFLLTLLGIYAAFGLGARLYDRKTGILSATLLASCQAFIYFNNDVRTDTILAASVIFAIWQIVEFSCTKKTRHFFAGMAGIACAMLSKGPIGLMVPLIALGAFFIGKREFKMLFKWYWLAGMALVLVLLSPMLWGLYRQFGMEGVKFYFWTQSFGRLTGENVFKDSSGYFFFVHTFLWAFLPWMLIAYYGIGVNAVRVIRNIYYRNPQPPFSVSSEDKVPCSNPALRGELGMSAEETEKGGVGTGGNNEAGTNFGSEMLLLCGIILPFIALSCSHYKLPHYIFVIFPLVAILTARTILELVNDPGKQKTFRIFYWAQFTLCVAAWIFALVCMTIFFPCKNILLWGVCIVCAFMTFYFSGNKHGALMSLVLPSLWAILGVNLMLNVHFFPGLLSYQGGSAAAEIVMKNNIPLDRFFGYHIQNHSTDFYLKQTVPNLDSVRLFDMLKKGNAWIYTEAQGIKLMHEMGYSPVIVDSIAHKHITKVTSKFLFYKTREKNVGRQYIVRVSAQLRYVP